MKSIGFFLTVFLSMLVVFLLATGEVKRWFSASEQRALEVLDLEPGGPAGSKERQKNIFEFPFYDVERAELKFVVQAEFSQEQFPADATLDDINHLVLRDGVIKVPHAAQQLPDQFDKRTPVEVKHLIDGVGPPGTSHPWKLLLKFKHAVYQRREGPPGKGPLEVLLTDGTGTTDDGTRFIFEELVFREQGQGTFSLSSTKPVSIQNRSVGVRSPNGLEGILEEQGAKSFTLTPPVSTLIDTAHSYPLQTGKEQEVPLEPAALSAESEEEIAVTCAGPLEILFEGRDRDASSADSSAPARTTIVFQDDVVMYPVDGMTKLDALPAAEGNRFECQRLEVELVHSEGQNLPRHAVATWKDGRVRAFVKRQSDGALYKLDADRLEWSAEPAHDGTSVESVAVLHGQPTLSGDDIQLEADRGVFYVTEDRILFESVEGTMTYHPRKDEDGPESINETDTMPAPPPLDGFWRNPRESAPRSPDRSPAEEKNSEQRAPQVWELLADQLELFLYSPQGQSGSRTREKTFSRFVASSERPDGVVIKGGSPERGKDTGPENFLATGKTLTYVEAENRATLEGTEALKPQFTYGESYLRARKIHIYQEKRAATFEGEVRGKVEHARFPFDVEAHLLSAWFHHGKEELRDLVAKGTPDHPVRVSTRTSRVFRFIGPELHWNQEREIAWLQGSSGANGESPGAGPNRSFARVELEGGELVADRIVFHSKTWTAYLTDSVTLRSVDKGADSEGPHLEVTTGKAEVEFFAKVEKGDGEPEGPLGGLAHIKSLHATRSPEQRIEIRTKSFVGRAEECTWDAASRELRFFGTGQQEIELIHEQFQGPILAREIIYDAARNRIILDGNVRGELVQSRPGVRPGPEAAAGDSGGVSRIEPASHRPDSASPSSASPSSDSMRWRFSTPSLEIQLRQVAGESVPKFEFLHAHDKVDLENVERGIQFRGDELIYTDETRKVRIFSPDGRFQGPQILVFDRRATHGDAAEEAPRPLEDAKKPTIEKVHRIDSQEIWILFFENPRAVPQRGEPRSWLLVQFKRDVRASFYLPPRSTKKRAEDLGPVWKMTAEKLTLEVDPSQPVDEEDTGSARRIIPWARAEGNVVFTTGVWEARAAEAIFDDPASQVTLYGSPEAPDARLYKDDELKLEARAIQLIQADGEPGLRWDSTGKERPRLPGFPE